MAIKVSLLLSLLLLASTACSANPLIGALAKLPKFDHKNWAKVIDIIDAGKDFVPLDGVAKTPAPPRIPTTIGLVKNGGFELPLPVWKTKSPKAIKVIDAKHFKVPSGSYAVELIEGRESVLIQDILTVPNKEYQLSFIVGDAKNGCGGNMKIVAGAGKEFREVPFKSVGEGHNKAVGFSFKAVGTSTRLVFLSASKHIKIKDRTLCGPVIDEVKVFPK